MLFLREIARELNVSQKWLKKLKYFDKNLLDKRELENLKDFFLEKNTNNGLIKARKIEKILKNLENKVA